MRNGVLSAQKSTRRTASTERVCLKRGPSAHQDKRRRHRWVLPGLGLVSLLWFLVRVIPKPSRATYPCQRAAAPLASTFVVWLLAVAGSTLAWRRGKEFSRQARLRAACVCCAIAVAAAVVAIVALPGTPAAAYVTQSHGPIGTAQGIHPGRVVWVHAPEATDWAGFEFPERWWQSPHTDLAVVEEMMSQAVRNVAGESSDATAWDTIFKHFNEGRGKGRRGYQAGEKIAIKINLTACNARSPEVDPVTYQKKASVMNSIDNSPQMLLALFRQLVYEAGVAPGNLAVGDPTGMIPQFMYDLLHPEFPEVQYFDNYGKAGSGRTRTEFSKVPFRWSAAAATGKVQDYIPVPFAEADYLINFAVLKGHSSGITVCGKNLYGALLRCPDGYLRGAGTMNYYDMHLSLPNAEWSPGMGHYRAIVDLMGHRELGGKTLLCLIDGLFGGYYWDSHPFKWKSAPFGDGINGDWPSSLFASQDPVAIDSVAHDFLLQEWPKVVTGGIEDAGSLQGGAEDYLHEAALADDPPSGSVYAPDQSGVRLSSLGVHEHWNNPTNKQYSRNLGLDHGIELLALQARRPEPRLTLRTSDRQAVLSWSASLEGLRLQRADTLTPPINWAPVGAPPAFVRGQNVVSNDLVGPSQFYRLAE